MSTRWHPLFRLFFLSQFDEKDGWNQWLNYLTDSVVFVNENLNETA